MKRVHSPKKSRQQAEESILRDMRAIKQRLDDHRASESEPVDKENVMTVLTRFMDIKRMTKMH